MLQAEVDACSALGYPAWHIDSAIEDGLCVIDPTRSKRLTYSKKNVREALAIEDAQDIIRNLNKLELKDRLLIALLIITGIRRGEALGLQWEDIDFDRKLINIRRSVRFVGNKGYIGPTKRKAGVRLILLEPQLEEILTALPHDGKYILGNGDFPITEMTYKRGWEPFTAPLTCMGLRLLCVYEYHVCHRNWPFCAISLRSLGMYECSHRF